MNSRLQILASRLAIHGSPPESEIAIRNAINTLPQENKEVLNLHYVHNIPRNEIALRLAWSLSKVNQKITRGITLLKYELDPGYFEEMGKGPNGESGNGSARP